MSSWPKKEYKTNLPSRAKRSYHLVDTAQNRAIKLKVRAEKRLRRKLAIERNEAQRRKKRTKK